MEVLANQEKEMLREHELVEEEERAKILIKQKKKKKKAGGEASEEEEATKLVDHTEVPFKLEKQFDQQLKVFKKVDYDMVEKVTKAKGKALKENDLKIYEKLEKNEMDKKEIEEYLLGDQKLDKNEINLDELNKDYGKDLDQKEYQEFWKDQPRKRPQSLKPMTRPGSSDAKLAALPTPERQRRQIRDQIFPEI